MEALAAFSLACNVLQLVETGCNVAKVLKEVYRTGNTEDNHNIALAAKQLNEAISRLQTSIPRPANRDDIELLDIAQRCADVASTLQSMVAPLALNAIRTRDKLKNSLKLLRPKQDTERLVKTLEICRDAINTSILIDLRSKTQMHEIEQQEGFSDLESDLQHFIRQQASLQIQENVKQHTFTRQIMIDSTKEIKNFHQTTVDSARYERLITSLYFNSMNARKNQITPAHNTTFEWIFDSVRKGSIGRNRSTHFQSEWDDLVEWLCNDQSIYWVSGKPGSGKSTFMRFIYNHKSTRRLLGTWAGEKPLILLEVYLWNSGSEGQQSFKGFLATLLVQILRQDRNIMPNLEQQFPFLSNKIALTDWSTSELLALLLFLTTSARNKFCVFIDGLDEAHNEAQEEILGLILESLLQSAVKICVSSRPYQQFEDAFEEMPKLRLHQLNRLDIRQIFDDKLGAAIKKAKFQLDEASFLDLRNKFELRAGGVLLWAHLAVNSLKRGLTNCDSVKQLRTRLNALPPELKQMYEHMWNSFNGDSDLYREQCARILKLVLMPIFQGRPLSVLTIYFCQKSLEKTNLAVLAGLSNEMLAIECEKMATHIKTRCIGLLEVVVESEECLQSKMSTNSEPSIIQKWIYTRVVFIHRTARDFLTTTPSGISILSQEGSSRFELLDSFIKARAHEVSLLPFVTLLGNPSASGLAGYKPPFDIADLLYTIRLTELRENETVILVHQVEDICMTRCSWIPCSVSAINQSLITKNNVLITGLFMDTFYARDFLTLTIEIGNAALFNHLNKNINRQLSRSYLQHCLCCWLNMWQPRSPEMLKLGALLMDLLKAQVLKQDIGMASDEVFYFQEDVDGIAYHTSVRSRLCRFLENSIHRKRDILDTIHLMCSKVFCSTNALEDQFMFTAAPDMRGRVHALHRPLDGIIHSVIFECNYIWYLDALCRPEYMKKPFLHDTIWRASSGAAKVKPQIQAIMLCFSEQPLDRYTYDWESYNFKAVGDQDSAMLSTLYLEQATETIKSSLESNKSDSRFDALRRRQVPQTMRKLFSATREVYERSPDIDGLALLRERGWIKYADDPGITRHPPPMFVDEVEEVAKVQEIDSRSSSPSSFKSCE